VQPGELLRGLVRILRDLDPDAVDDALYVAETMAESSLRAAAAAAADAEVMPSPVLLTPALSSRSITPVVPSDAAEDVASGAVAGSDASAVAEPAAPESVDAIETPAVVDVAAIDIATPAPAPAAAAAAAADHAASAVTAPEPAAVVAPASPVVPLGSPLAPAAGLAGAGTVSGLRDLLTALACVAHAARTIASHKIGIPRAEAFAQRGTCPLSVLFSLPVSSN
jgi:hypothetical protein